MQNLTVQIPAPCHERWAIMRPTEQGRFCASCQKTVVDFSALSDRELVRMLSQSTVNACGRFRTDQLNRSLSVSKPAGSSGWRRWVGVLASGLVGWQTAQANQTISPAQTVTVLRPKNIKQSVRDTTNQDTMQVITGHVSAIDGVGQKFLPGATVVIKGTNRGATTDLNGVYRLLIPADLLNTRILIVASCIGFINQEMNINAVPQNLSIALREDEEALNQVITVGGYHVSHWQKFKHKLFHRNR